MFWNFLKLGAISLAALIVVISLVIYYLINNSLPLPHETPEHIYTLFEKDLQTLKENPVFKATPRKSNAHLFLTERFKMNGSLWVKENGKTIHKVKSLKADESLWNEENEKVTHFFSNHRGWSSNKENFYAILDSPTLSEFDTSWIEKIYEFDHWNYFEDPSSYRTIQSVFEGSTVELPNYSEPPDINMFLKWTLLYALQKVKNQKPEEGLKLLRHSTQLINSTRGLIGQTLAARGLEVERQIANFTNTKWKSTPENLQKAYRRVSWAWPGVIDESSIRQKNLKRWEKYMTPELGMCSAAVESPSYISAMSAFFEYKPWPLELDLRSNIEKSRQRQKNLLAQCGLEDLIPLLAPSKKPTPLLPYQRQLIGLQLLKVSRASYIEGAYRKISSSSTP